MRKNGSIALIFHTIFLCFIAAPLLTIILVSFTDKGFMSMPFDGASLRWYRAAFQEPEFVGAIQTSLALGSFSASIALLLAVPAAVGLARSQFIGRNSINAVLMSPLLIPHVVLGVALLRFFTDTGINGTFIGMVAAHVIIIMPYALRLCLVSILGMDTAFEQAATSLGAGPWTAFRRITFRLMLPGVVSGWVLAFIHSFDEVTMSAFIASPSLMPLPVALYHRIEDSIDPMVTAVSSLLILGSLILMLVLDRLYGIDRLFAGKQ